MAESASSLLDFALRRRESDDAASPDGQITGFIRNLVAGGLRGRDLAKTDQAQAVDQQSKVVALHDKIQEMKSQAENARISRNLAKRYGLLPADPGEKDAARSAALDDLAVKNPPTDTSSAGRIASLMMGSQEYDAVPGFSEKGGMTLQFENSNKYARASAAAAKAAEDKQKMLDKARDLAKDAARRWKYSQATALAGNDPVALAKYANVQPTPDEEEMFIPEMLSYLKGDGKGFEQAARSRRGKAGEQTLGALDDISSKIDDLKKRGSDLNPFNNDSNELDKLTTRRASLLKAGGADVAQVRSQYTDEIKTLSAKLKSGQGTPEDRARLISLARRVKQITDIGGQ